jgi:hypothetical protein
VLPGESLLERARADMDKAKSSGILRDTQLSRGDDFSDQQRCVPLTRRYCLSEEHHM